MLWILTVSHQRYIVEYGTVDNEVNTNWHTTPILFVLFSIYSSIRIAIIFCFVTVVSFRFILVSYFAFALLGVRMPDAALVARLGTAADRALSSASPGHLAEMCRVRSPSPTARRLVLGLVVALGLRWHETNYPLSWRCTVHVVVLGISWRWMKWFLTFSLDFSVVLVLLGLRYPLGPRWRTRLMFHLALTFCVAPLL